MDSHCYRHIYFLLYFESIPYCKYSSKHIIYYHQFSCGISHISKKSVLCHCLCLQWYCSDTLMDSGDHPWYHIPFSNRLFYYLSGKWYLWLYKLESHGKKASWFWISSKLLTGNGWCGWWEIHFSIHTILYHLPNLYPHLWNSPTNRYPRCWWYWTLFFVRYSSSTLG